MRDQAQNLRDTFTAAKNKGSIYCISSGKGGVGKSGITINLGICLAKSGSKVAIIDADIGLSNLEILIGKVSIYNFSDCLNRGIPFEKATVEGPCGLKILSGGSGIAEVSALDEERFSAFIELLKNLKKDYDYILIDTGAGISNNVTKFAGIADEVIVVTTCEPTALADAYALIKLLFTKEISDKISVITNRAENKKDGETTFKNLNAVTKKFLNKELKYLGLVSDDKEFVRAVKAQKPIIIYNENSKASKNIFSISKNILGNETSKTSEYGFIAKIRKIFA